MSAGTGGLGYSSRLTGKLNHPRWYSSGVLLPDGSVMAFSGADRDEVVSPGFEIPVTQVERFDPATETWSPMAQANNPRTYHNTAMLLPDGRVLVGGHAPINTAFLSNIDLPGGFAPAARRDSSSTTRASVRFSCSAPTASRFCASLRRASTRT